jgi:hypothetical protein
MYILQLWTVTRPVFTVEITVLWPSRSSAQHGRIKTRASPSLPERSSCRAAHVHRHGSLIPSSYRVPKCPHLTRHPQPPENLHVCEVESSMGIKLLYNIKYAPRARIHRLCAARLTPRWGRLPTPRLRQGLPSSRTHLSWPARVSMLACHEHVSIEPVQFLGAGGRAPEVHSPRRPPVGDFPRETHGCKQSLRQGRY